MNTKITLLLLSIFSSLFGIAQFSSPKVLSADNLFVAQTIGGEKNDLLDVNNDGRLDVLAVRKSDHTGNYIFHYMEANADLSFVAPQSLFIFPDYITNIQCCNIADMNGDGFEDLIFTGNLTEIYVLYNDGNGGFSNLNFLFNLNIGTFGFIQFHVEDLNQDNQKDIFIENYSFYSRWYRNNGGAFVDEGNLYSYNLANYERFDVDNDGDLDFVEGLNTSTGTYSVFVENLGNHVLAQADTVLINSLTINHQFNFDFDDDGKMEMVYGNWMGAYYIFSFNQTNFVVSDTLPTNLQINGQPGHLSVDIDNDGDLDLLMKSSGGNDLVLYKKNPLNSFPLEQGVVISDEIPYIHRVYFEDIDGDGIKDIANVNPQKPFVLKGIGNGIIQTEKHPILLQHSGFKKIMVGDLNGDGITDIFNQSFSNSYLNVWLGKGNGVYDQRYLTAENALGTEVPFSFTTTGNLNGDNLTDFLLIGPFDGSNLMSVALFEGNAGLHLSNPEVQNSYSSFVPMSLDYDEDGITDYFYLDSPADSFYLCHNDGQGNFTKYAIAAPSYYPYDIGFYDINNDGFKDLTYRSTSNLVPDTVVICYSDSNHQFMNVDKLTPFGSNYTAGNYVFEDVTLDGKLDLVVKGYNFNNQFALFQQGNGGVFPVTPVQLLPNSVLSTQIVINDFQFADVNNDGWNDLVYSKGLTYEPEKGMYYCKSLGNGSFEAVETLITPLHASKFELKDIDNDGDQDLLYMFVNDVFSVMYNESVAQANVKGHVFADLNGNGVKDAGEEGLPYVKVKTNPTSDITITDFNGNFDFNINAGLGQYELMIEKGGWSVSTDSLVYHISIDTVGTSYVNLDFGLEPDSLFYQLSAKITTGQGSCNSLSKVWVNIRNEGTIKPSGVFLVNLDDSLDYFDASVLPDSINGQSFYFNFSDIGFGNEHKMDVSYYNPSFLSMGTYQLNKLKVDVLENGNIVSNFTDSTERMNTCAYDPNDKTSIPAGLGVENYINEEDTLIEYLIRFQNTGNDTATNVVISDIIGDELDISSFEFISASHNMTYEIKATREIVFTFENIFLPDSNVNYLGSQGYVKFNMELVPSLPKGTVINNTAYIYFDQNPAVITNTAFLTIIDCAALNENVSLVNAYDSVTCDYYGWMELPNLLPEGGVFSGTGIVNDTMFDPSTVGLGVHTLNYSVDSENGCPLNYSFDIVVDECLGLEQYGITSISIYPNPFNEVLNIVFDAELSDVTIELVNATGAVAVTKEVEKSDVVQLKRENLPTGAYVLRVVKNGEILFSRNVQVQ